MLIHFMSVLDLDCTVREIERILNYVIPSNEELELYGKFTRQLELYGIPEDVKRSILRILLLVSTLSEVPYTTELCASSQPCITTQVVSDREINVLKSLFNVEFPYMSTYKLPRHEARIQVIKPSDETKQLALAISKAYTYETLQELSGKIADVDIVRLCLFADILAGVLHDTKSGIKRKIAYVPPEAKFLYDVLGKCGTVYQVVYWKILSRALWHARESLIGKLGREDVLQLFEHLLRETTLQERDLIIEIWERTYVMTKYFAIWVYAQFYKELLRLFTELASRHHSEFRRAVLGALLLEAREKSSDDLKTMLKSIEQLLAFAHITDETLEEEIEYLHRENITTKPVEISNKPYFIVLDSERFHSILTHYMTPFTQQLVRELLCKANLSHLV